MYYLFIEYFEDNKVKSIEKYFETDNSRKKFIDLFKIVHKNIVTKYDKIKGE